MAAPAQLTQTKLLIGEGAEEVCFFQALLRHIGVAGVQVESYGGKSQLPAYLVSLTLRPGFRSLARLGVTRDADENAGAAFQSVRDALRRTRLPTPGVSGEYSGDNPCVGVFILPDGRSPGMLEDVCLASLGGCPELDCIDEYLDCVAATAHRQPSPRSKARIHAWLASCDKPDRRLGEAALANCWSWDHFAFDAMKEFLRQL